MAEFGNLYTYNTSDGTIIPYTDDVKSGVENAFKEIFGSDFATEPETLGGRLIEAITLLFKTVCSVNAMNAGMVNPNVAVGAYLDQIGALFGIERESGESDAAYRKRIKSSSAIGNGYAESIRKKLSEVEGTSNIVVLDNGNEDPAVMPLDEYGNSLPHSITVDPHSVFISVKDGDNGSIAEAIMKSKSAGCGFTRNSDYGTITPVSVVEGGVTLFTAYIYRPTRIYVNVSVVVKDDAYVGKDITGETIGAIKDYISSLSTNSTIYKNDIVSCVAAVGSNIIVDSVSFLVGKSAGSLTSSDKIVIPPYSYVDISEQDISVSVI